MKNVYITSIPPNIRTSFLTLQSEDILLLACDWSPLSAYIDPPYYIKRSGMYKTYFITNIKNVSFVHLLYCNRQSGNDAPLI